MATLIGHYLGRYHILEQLGEGGMAIVYKASDTRLERDVAVKVIRTENILPSALERSLKRFEREAKALARLTHPNIVKVMDYGEYEGKPYLVMEYLPGGTLKQKLGKPIPWNEAISILLPIAKALDFAHRQNMIHRDVKPSNILITAGGEPVLTDFGIAKIIDDEATVDLTGTSAAVGTPEYMAPEQAIAKTVDHRADIYTLGVVLYEMVTGRKPFVADTPMAVLIKHATESLPRPTQFTPNLPTTVENLLIKALAKKPDDRYQVMGEMVAAWQGALESSGRESVPAFQPATRNRQISTDTMEDTRDTVDENSLDTVDQFAQEEVVIKKPHSVKPKQAVNNETVISLAPGVEMSFMRVPAGKFLMGSPNDIGFDDEHPQREIYLDEYWMGKTPVTNLQYQAFINATGHKSPHDWQKGIHPTGKEQHPVVFVSWQDAIDFCKWVGEESGELIRLPTEAEWEKAARGTDGRMYPWGNQNPDLNLCNYWRPFPEGTMPVGKLSPQGDSPYGCVDMAGNVWEWVEDWYSRGGSWSNVGDFARVSFRNWNVPLVISDNLGFRCIRLQ